MEKEGLSRRDLFRDVLTLGAGIGGIFAGRAWQQGDSHLTDIAFAKRIGDLETQMIGTQTLLITYSGNKNNLDRVSELVSGLATLVLKHSDELKSVNIRLVKLEEKK